MLVNTAGLKTTLNAIKEYIRKQISKLKRPDWNQNDEDAQDYVKNRTHWLERVILSEAEFEAPIKTCTLPPCGL